LLRDLVSVLQDPCNEQLGLSPSEMTILARRAEQVLELVDEHESDGLSLTQPPQFQGSTGRTQQRHSRSVTRRTQEGASLVAPLASQNLTVASTGLRVRLIPVDDDINRPTGEDAGNDCSEPATGTPGPRLGKR
jgi:hypothetical protein